ncbi:MAG: hypothetical protein K0Q55_3467, partial [Verrucomicrobia bacterium]|nr:hypothetical protein [Verrucomicrobiota bacterium]
MSLKSDACRRSYFFPAPSNVCNFLFASELP